MALCKRHNDRTAVPSCGHSLSAGDRCRVCGPPISRLFPEQAGPSNISRPKGTGSSCTKRQRASGKYKPNGTKGRHKTMFGGGQLAYLANLRGLLAINALRMGVLHQPVPFLCPAPRKAVIEPCEANTAAATTTANLCACCIS